MAISQQKVFAFKNRKLNSFAQYKDMEPEKLEALAEASGLEFHTKPRRAQLLCTLLGWHQESFMFLLGLGAGKALAHGEPVLMADYTWKFIEDLQVGEYVLGWDGEPKVIEGVYPQGVTELRKVRFTGGRYSVCSPDHLWTVWMFDGKKQTLPLHEIERRGLVSGHRRNGVRYRWKVPCFEKQAGFDHYRKIISIEPYESGESTCIKVEGGHFITRDYMGTHNTKISLDLAANRKREGQIQSAIVLVPNTANLWAWQIEVKKHAPNLSVAVIDQNGPAARERALYSGADIVVCTYVGLGNLLSKNKKLDNKKVQRLCQQFQMVVMDEITAIKNPQSRNFRMCKLLSVGMKYRYGLTGTPIHKDPADLWAQFWTIDHGYCLGENITLFRETYFKQDFNRFGFREYKFDRRFTSEVARRVESCSIRFAEHEVQDLPEAIGGLGSDDYLRIPVEMPKAQTGHYRSALGDLRSAEDATTIDQAYAKMRMVCSGWCAAMDEGGDRVEVEFPKVPKLDALIDLLNDIPEDEKVVVVAWYHHSIQLMQRRFRKEKIRFTEVTGRISAKKKIENLESFCSKGGPRVLIGSTAISKGINLQGASRYMVFYESPDSTIERAQIEGRIRREGGIEGTRYYYDLCTKDSVEESILDSLRTGRNIHELLIEGKK